EHPTQALLDAYTIKREKGRLQNLNVMMVGDLKYSRTIHSLLHLLSLYPDNKYHMVSSRRMDLPKEYKNEDMCYHDDLDKALDKVGNLDVLYMTRSQKERHDFPSNTLDYFILKPERLG